MTPRLEQLATILAMLDDLSQITLTLDGDIALERSKQPTAPLLASLTLRRAKIRETVSTLEGRLANLRSFGESQSATFDRSLEQANCEG